MAYNLELAGRVRRQLAGLPGIVEKKMFGGLSFMVQDKMCCGVLNDDLVVRVGPDRYQEALVEPAARPMEFTGRPLKGMVYVAPEGLGTDDELKNWVDRCVSFVNSLPPSGPRASRNGG